MQATKEGAINIFVDRPIKTIGQTDGLRVKNKIRLILDYIIFKSCYILYILMINTHKFVKKK